MRAAITSWGPAGWTYLHTVTFVYPNYPKDSDKEDFVKFLYAFANVIPCLRCRTDFMYMVKKNFGETVAEGVKSEHVRSRDNLVKIIIDMHNEVNRKLKKKQVSYEHVIDLYTKNRNIPYVYFVVIILIIVVFLLLLNCKRSRIK